jgi:dolichol-phosphate mannosyltransferase
MAAIFNRNGHVLSETTVVARPQRRSTEHLYDIDGHIRIDSAIKLPELEFFRVETLDDVDLVIRIGTVGGLRPRGKIDLRPDWERLVYREHLGGLFANFQIDLRHPVRIDAGFLLARSPHVLYTNVVEPLLRFLLVLKGRMLLHAACVHLDGTTVMLSAKTDTGKTSTILTLLRQGGGIFLSDDMTIVSEDGRASRYPKPLTISAHTLRAVPQNRLRFSQRASLAIQSRLHSKGGRSVGKSLGSSNLPIMSMNAFVQAAIPPPKYMVTDLVACTIGQEVPIELLYVIERGQALTERIETEQVVDELLENTDDAYGFPPYSRLAPRLVLGGETHDELRRRERQILTRALSGAYATRLRVENFEWAEHIRADVARVREAAPTSDIDREGLVAV